MLFAAFTALALAASLEQSSETLTTDDLVTIARSVQNHRPVDRFTPPLDQSQWAGKPFRVEMAVPDHELIGWSYDPAAGQITVRSEAWMPILSHRLPHGAFGGNDDYIKARPFYARRRDGSGYVGANAFGVRARVRERYETNYAITELWPYYRPISTATLEHTWAASPDQARAITKQLKIAVTGHLEARGGDVVVCYEDFTEATLNNPEETLERNCVMSVVAETIELIDGTTGEVLKVMTREVRPPNQVK